MPYAIKKNGQGWRSVDSAEDCTEEEYFSETRPEGNPATEVDPRSSMHVTNFQAQAALHRAGLHDAVEALMSDPSTDFEARLAWRRAQTFSRLSPTVVTMASALGISDEQLDDLFALAATLEA